MYKRLLILPVLFVAFTAAAQHIPIHTDSGEDLRADIPTADSLTRFLYRYMPLCDRADYTTDFFCANAELTRRAAQEMPWGKLLSNRLLYHFVLPLRVNNEPLDSFRLLYYDELARRVRGLTMTEAAIAVNHWCHERVTYQPTDARTSSPLQTIRTAYGRCGEESTLCVAAMRTIGIPARQVYTPRWAHCDDNHAWVEVWTDGRWHFLGACEPEPVLDLGWFNVPASRGMLMHTRVFGNYQGEEDVVCRQPTFTEINVTPNYAPTRRVVVRVTHNGNPVEDALVEFKIYNYAEFYTAVSRTTDANGQTSLVSGFGDLLVWASKEGAFGYRKVDFATDTLVTIPLEKSTADRFTEEIDIRVPRENCRLPYVAPEQRLQNNLALAYEDSLRQAYEQTMTALPLLATEIDSLLWKSRGNNSVIRAFLNRYGAAGLPLLRTLTDKDLRDITAEVLDDHQERAAHDAMTASYIAHVLSPRVALEPLTPWRSVLQNTFHFKSVDEIAQWCRDSLTITSDSNLGGTYVTPLGVLRTRQCDRRSRDVFFVCLCRASGIEAWLDDVTGEVRTSQTLPTATATDTYGTLRFTGDASLGYINRFTVSRLTPEGRLSLLTFPEECPLGALEAKAVPAGTYVLTTGTRRSNGDVLAALQTFQIEEGKETLVSVVPRTDADTAETLGHIAHITGPVVLAYIAEGDEPSNHVVRDICARRDDFDKAGIAVYFVMGSSSQMNKFRRADFAPFPAATEFLADDRTILEPLAEALPLTDVSRLPLVLFIDAQGSIRFFHQGYTIAIGDAVLRAAE